MQKLIDYVSLVTLALIMAAISTLSALMIGHEFYRSEPDMTLVCGLAFACLLGFAIFAVTISELEHRLNR